MSDSLEQIRKARAKRDREIATERAETEAIIAANKILRDALCAIRAWGHVGFAGHDDCELANVTALCDAALDEAEEAACANDIVETLVCTDRICEACSMYLSTQDVSIGRCRTCGTTIDEQSAIGFYE